MRWPGFEPGSQAWKARMLTVTLPTHKQKEKIGFYKLYCYGILPSNIHKKKKEKKII
jgi:hypothetical protein